MKRLRALLLAAVTTGGLVCFGQEPDWWKSQRDLTTLLLASNTPIAKLVAAVTARPAVDGPAAMFKLCVFTRAGMNEQVLAALRELKAACPTLNGYQVNSIYYDACDHETAWDVAQAVVEVFAENVNDLTLENRLLKHWLESFLDTGNWRDAEAIFPVDGSVLDNSIFNQKDHFCVLV